MISVMHGFLRIPAELRRFVSTFRLQVKLQKSPFIADTMEAFSSNVSAGLGNSRWPVPTQAAVVANNPQQASVTSSSVISRVDYAKPAPDGQELFWSVYEKPEELDRATNLDCVQTEVCITDMRTKEREEGRFTLQRNGFQLEKLQVPPDIDWTDDADVRPQQLWMLQSRLEHYVVWH